MFDNHDKIKEKCNEIINNIHNFIYSDISHLLVIHNIHPSWHALFKSQEVNDRLLRALENIYTERKTNIIYPPDDHIFRVFERDMSEIKIVLLGQDPYIKCNQAMGISFSVPKTTMIPPSLYNIYKELVIEFPERNYKFTNGDLTKWVDRGMFLLNSALTVRENKSNSHQCLWSWFTDKVIKYIDQNRENVIFLLLGRNAIMKQMYVDKNKNHVVTGVHPSPLSANNGFFNSNIFKKVEDLLGYRFDWTN